MEHFVVVVLLQRMVSVQGKMGIESGYKRDSGIVVATVVVALGEHDSCVGGLHRSVFGDWGPNPVEEMNLVGMLSSCGVDRVGARKALLGAACRRLQHPWHG